MPSPKLWKPSEVLVVRPGRNYTVADYQQFFKDISFEDGWLMRQDTKDLIMDIKPPNVKVHCLHGHNLETPGTLVYTEKTWFDSQPVNIPDNGDGTVNMRSLLYCLQWQKEQKEEVIHKVFDNASHLGILKNLDVINYIKSVVVN